MSVRSATADDLVAIAASERDAFAADPWTEDQVRDGVTGALRTARYLVLEVDDRVVGHAVVSVAAEDAELQRIAVAAHERGRGLGRLLLDACLTDAADRGAERVILEVSESNAAALGLYAAAGFVELARRPRYYRDGATAVVLSRSVKEPV